MPITRACDACKRRKVKCDAGGPCANCRISQLSCEYRISPRKRGRKVSKAPADSGIPEILAQSPSAGSASTIGGSIAHGHHSHSVIPFLDCPESPRPYPDQSVQAGLHDNVSVGSSPTLIGRTYDVGQIYTELVTIVNAVVPSGTIVDVIHTCIDQFAQYIFPNTPIAHEHTLRAAVSLFLPGNHPVFTAISPLSDMNHQLADTKAFTVITALCAFVISIMPESLVPDRRLLAGPFLQSSKAVLRTYEEYDLEHPDSTSLTIRVWHSGALQNTTGKPGAAYHVQGEAGLLAQRLRLYDDKAVARHSVLESQLLRANFWLIYMSEKASAAFENRPSILNELLFDGELTLQDRGQQEEYLLDAGKKVNQGNLESRLAVGFHMKRRVWSSAADLIIDIKSYARRQKRGMLVADQTDFEMARLIDAYIDFSGLLNTLPSCLRHLDSQVGVVADDPGVEAYQKVCFWTQRSNIVTVFHCLKLVILQKCIDHRMPSVIGLNDQPLSWAMRKLEIIQDFLLELQQVPFVCFKVQGEAAVERVRRVGSIVLEMVHNVENKTMKEQAKSQFAQLLDILAKLDSRACDELSGAQACNTPRSDNPTVLL